MKNLFVAVTLSVVLFVVSNASAQGDLNFSVNGGGTLSNFNFNGESDRNMIIGYTIGIACEYGITDAFYVQSGLSLLSKGAKAKEDGLGDVLKVSATFRPTYLQIPMHAAYKFDINENVKLLLNAGPYLAFGVGGKTSVETKYSGNREVTEKTDFFGDDIFQHKNFDLGIGMGVGVELEKLVFNLGYDMGLLDIDRMSNVSTRTQSTALTVGYKF
jgi:hypothetical protein